MSWVNFNMLMPIPSCAAEKSRCCRDVLISVAVVRQDVCLHLV